MGFAKHTPRRQRLFNAFFDDAFARDLFINDQMSGAINTTPSANIKESEQSFEIELAAPGFDKKDFALELNDRVLTLSAARKLDNEEETERYTIREFSYKHFRRNFQLPENINVEGINARYEQGLLHVSIPKKEAKKAVKTITVK